MNVDQKRDQNKPKKTQLGKRQSAALKDLKSNKKLKVENPENTTTP